MKEVLFTFSFMVDDIDMKIFLLELVFRGGECSVASSRRPYTTPAAVPHTLRETRLSSKWKKPSLQVKAGCYEDVREENYQLTGAVRGILGNCCCSISLLVMYLFDSFSRLEIRIIP